MARFNDTSVMQRALQAHLEPGETLRHQAYGVKQPPLVLIVLGFILGILPGVILVMVMTKEYVIGLTDRRFVVLEFKGSGIDVKQVRAWRLDAMPPVETSTGGLFTHIKVADPAGWFVAKFHRLGTPDNREQAMAIAAGVKD
jgi:hypothetical protein